MATRMVWSGVHVHSARTHVKMHKLTTKYMRADAKGYAMRSGEPMPPVFMKSSN